jgi:hypothetical protein
MQQLLREANLHARLANDGGSGGSGKKVAITARDVRKVSQVSFAAAGGEERLTMERHEYRLH